MQKHIKLLWASLFILGLVACLGSGSSKLKGWKMPDTDFPLGDPGPFFVGTQQMSFTDESRDGRAVAITIWYPAIKPEDATGSILKMPSRMPAMRLIL